MPPSCSKLSPSYNCRDEPSYFLPVIPLFSILCNKCGVKILEVARSRATSDGHRDYPLSRFDGLAF